MYSDKIIYKLSFGSVFCLLLLLFLGVKANLAMAQSTATVIKGVVTDAVTKEALVGVSVFIPEAEQGTSTGLAGNFSMQLNRRPSKIRFSYLGYKTVVISVKPGQEEQLNVTLEPGEFELREVVVQGSRGRYRNKNNSSVDLIREIVSHKAQNRPEQVPYFEYEQYEKMQLSLVNTPEKLKRNIFLRRYDFITSNLDTTTLKGKAILPFFIQEKISEHYYQKDPESRKTVVKAEKKIDYGDFFDKKGMASYMQHMYQDIDIYNNNIPVLTNQFLSPIADMAPAFYKFHILDTISTEKGQKLAEIYFEPRNPAAFMFTGTLFVVLDGSYAVQRVTMKVNENVSINWVRSLQIDLHFTKEEDSRYYPGKSKIKTDFGLIQNSDAGFYGERVVSYKKYRINEARPAGFYKEDAMVLQEKETKKEESYWHAARHDSLTAAEAKTYTDMDSLANMTSYKRVMNLGVALIAGYRQLGPNIEIGPLNTFYSFNPVEGFRLRLGGRTTPNFSRKVMTDAYVAYGFRDEKWKYFLSGSYSFTDKSVFEFPVRAVRASFQKDTSIPGQELQFVQENNFLLSFKRGENDKWIYNKIFTIDYLHEFRSNLSYKLGVKSWQQSPAGALQFLRAGKIGEDLASAEVNTITTSETSLELRWAPNEKFFQGKLYRTPIANRYPVFTLQATTGIKGLFGGQYDYQKVTLNIYKRFYLSQLGYSDVVTQGGYTFGQVPFPLLMIHRANQTYSFQLQSYNLMNFLEFVSDRYVSIHIDHTFNGFIFNKIPILKKARLREFVTFKMLYGDLRDENIPNAHPGLLRFPYFDDGRRATHTLKSRPYMEASVGIGNIFNFFRIDVVKRLTWLENPNVSGIGLRGRVKFDF